MMMISMVMMMMVMMMMIMDDHDDDDEDGDDDDDGDHRSRAVDFTLMIHRLLLNHRSVQLRYPYLSPIIVCRCGGICSSPY